MLSKIIIALALVATVTGCSVTCHLEQDGASERIETLHDTTSGHSLHRCYKNHELNTCECVCANSANGPWVAAPTAAPTKAPTAAPTKAPTDAPTKAPTDAPTNADIDGIPLSEFANWKCFRGYPGFAWKQRHHVHTIAMSGEVGSSSAGDQTVTIANTDTHNHAAGSASALHDDTFDGCLEHALHHHYADQALPIQGITYACHNTQAWTTVGYKRCEVHTTATGDSMHGGAGNMGDSGTSSGNYGMVLDAAGSHVTCLRNEDVHDDWGSAYDNDHQMTLQQARLEYTNCANNGRTDSGMTHQQHSPDHYDSNGVHLRL